MNRWPDMEMSRTQLFSSLGSLIQLQIGVAGIGKKGGKGNSLTRTMVNFDQFMGNITWWFWMFLSVLPFYIFPWALRKNKDIRWHLKVSQWYLKVWNSKSMKAHIFFSLVCIWFQGTVAKNFPQKIYAENIVALKYRLALGNHCKIFLTSWSR